MKYVNHTISLVLIDATSNENLNILNRDNVTQNQNDKQTIIILIYVFCNRLDDNARRCWIYNFALFVYVIHALCIECSMYINTKLSSVQYVMQDMTSTFIVALCMECGISILSPQVFIMSCRISLFRHNFKKISHYADLAENLLLLA